MKSIFVISFILFLDLVAFTIILPLFPSIIEFYDVQTKSSSASNDVGKQDGALQQIHVCMEWMKSFLGMPDRQRYNNVLVGGEFVNSPYKGMSIINLHSTAPRYSCMS